MATKLSGVLLDGLSKPIINADIVLIAKGNTITILSGSHAVFRTDGNGAYSITVNPGYYVVMAGPMGREPYKLGEMSIFADSPAGSLNGYLVDFAPEDTTPEVIAIVKELINQAGASASASAKSAVLAATARDDTIKANTAAQQAKTTATEQAAIATEQATAAKQAQSGASGSANTASQAVTTIQGLKTQIETTSSQALTDIGTAKTAGVKAVNDAGTTNITAMNQIKADVQQLKTDTTGLKDAAAASALSASGSAGTATTGATTATQKADAAAGSAQTAKTEADRAKTEADKIVPALANVWKNAIALDAKDLDTVFEEGPYYQHGNANATTANHYPIPAAGSLLVLRNAANNALKGVTQLYFPYNSNRSFRRTFDGASSALVWNAWQEYYLAGTPLYFDDLPQTTYYAQYLSKGTMGQKSYLRKFRGGAGDTIYHETVTSGQYRLAVGNSDDRTVFSVDHLGGSNVEGYLGDKIIVKNGSYGLGLFQQYEMGALGWCSGFLMYPSNKPEVPANVAGWQSCYGNSRRAQLVMGTGGRLFARFSMSTELIDSTTPWKECLYKYDATPRFEWGVEVSNKPDGDNTGRILYIGSNSAENNLPNGGCYLVNRLAGKALQLMDNGTLNFDNKDIPVFGQANVNFGSGFTVSNTQGSQSYVAFNVQNSGRPSTDNGARISIEIPHTTERPYLLQRRNDGTTAGQIVNTLPQLFGEILVRNAYKLNLANGNWNNYVNTQFTTFISGGTTHGALNGPNVGYGNMMTIGTGNIGATGDYATQVIYDKSTAIPYLRCMNDNAAGTWTDWQRIAVNPVSDENKKNIRGDLDVENGLNNISNMEFKVFTFKDDETERERRGVISQQVMQIDPDYVHDLGTHLCLDTTPMLLDALAAIKALKARDEKNKQRISQLEQRLTTLEQAVQTLMGVQTLPTDPDYLP